MGMATEEDTGGLQAAFSEEERRETAGDVRLFFSSTVFCSGGEIAKSR
jgi:hypothetical protein